MAYSACSAGWRDSESGVSAMNKVPTAMICSSCKKPIAKGRGGIKGDGEPWHTKCFNQAFMIWALGIGQSKPVKRKR